MPTDLHLALQHYYAGDEGLTEVRVAGYVVDVLRDDIVYEIQTRGFGALRAKLGRLTKTHRVVLVHPIAARRIVVRVAQETGEELSARRSPKRGDLMSVFGEMPHLVGVLGHANLAFEVALTAERELRVDDGRGSWRRKGVSVCGRELVEVLETHRFDTPADFLRLLPAELPERFSVADLAEATHTRTWLAGKMAYALRHMGAIRHVDKRGNAFIYERAPAPAKPRRRKKPPA